MVSDNKPINPRFAEGMHLNFVSGPRRYRNHTDKPVRFVTVADKENGAVLGYVWACDEDDAAGWEPRQAGGPHAVNEGGFWIRRLRSAKERGLLPSQALAELLADPEPAGKGRGLADSLTDAPNAAAVEALAQSE